MKLFAIFFIALCLRLGVIFLAHHGDLNNNISWGTLAVTRGLNGFYESGSLPREAGGEVGWPYSAPNQPPLTILLFFFCRLLWQGVENAGWYLNNHLPIFPSSFIWFWESKGMDLLVKLPSVIADLLMGLLIWKYFSKDKKKAMFAASVWLFNPVIWYNSTVWGQTDVIVNLLGFTGILFLLRKNLPAFATFFTLSLLFKGSLIIFIPILLCISIWQKYKTREWLHAVGHVLFWTILVAVWFHPQADLFIWLANLYNIRILPGEIGYLTANAFNFWWLVDSGKTLDSTIYFGLPARIWGFIFTSGGIAVVIYWLRKNLSDKNIFFALSLISLISFLFMTRIHERYLYPFFPSATILLGFNPEFSILYAIGSSFAYSLFSIVHLLNLYNLFWVPNGLFLEHALTPEVINIFCIAILALFVIYAASHIKVKKS